MSVLDTIRFAVRTAQLGKVTHWSEKSCQRLAHRRLERLVRHAVQHSPFFRRKYDGVSLDRIKLTDLPPSNKQELLHHFDEAVTDSRVRRNDVEAFLADRSNIGRWYLNRYAVSHTSGSQGAAMIILQDRKALEVLFSLMSARANVSGRPGVAEGWRRLRSPARAAIVAQNRGFYPSASAFEFMTQITRPFAQVEWFSAAHPTLSQALNDFQPTVLIGYASVLEALALQSDSLHLQSLRQIANSSEQLSVRARNRINKAFGVPVLDHYGAGECLFLSDGCATDGGAHINADWAIVEVVDDEYQPVPPGVLGSKVLITNLANHVQPFIRYELSDQLVMATSKCRCGSRLPRIERIEGRSAEAFWFLDADCTYKLISGVLFHSVIDTVHDVREWRAIQTDRNRIELQLEFLSDSESDVDSVAIINQLHSFGLSKQVRVDVESVIGLRPNAQTGKYRRMISQVGPPPVTRE